METLTDEQTDTSTALTGHTVPCRQATREQRQSGFDAPARQLDKLLTKLERELSQLGLPVEQQHWVMLTALPGYLCCRHCYEALCNAQRVQQVTCLMHADCHKGC